jgi:probable F420-dependent oxidoreductase
MMRLGAVFPQAEFQTLDPEEVIAFVRGVEAAGYDHLLVYDHILGADSGARPDWDGPYDHRDAFLEPLVLFSYLARACALEFVTDILILPQRQTAVVAKQAATLAVLAPGRLRLGVGIGWNAVEYDALGVDFRSRAARIEEQIPLLRRLWTEPVLSHSGRFDNVDAAGLAPLPTRPIPIWIGCADHPAALARVGRLADGWLPMPQVRPGRGLEESWTQVNAAAVEAGRDPAEIGLEGNVWVRPDRLDKIAEHVDSWQAAGAQAVSVNTLRGGLRWPDQHLELLQEAAERCRR